MRRITIAANRVVKDEGFFQVDLFTDTTKLEKEKKLQSAMLGLKKKFGKNAVLKGTNYLDGATMRERNQQIHGLQETDAGSQVFCLRLSGLHEHGNLLRPQNCPEEEKAERPEQ